MTRHDYKDMFRPIAATAAKVDICRGTSMWDEQSKDWDTTADFNLGVNWTVSAGTKMTDAGNKLSMTGTEVVDNVVVSDWVTFAAANEFHKWMSILYDATDNDGEVVVQVEGSVTGVVATEKDFDDRIENDLTDAENFRFQVTFRWTAGAASPELDYASVKWR